MHSHQVNAVVRLISVVFAVVCGVFVSSSIAAADIVAAGPTNPCPDVEVVFARGTFEPPGVGATGQAYVDALQARLGPKYIEVYPVNYPASLDFSRGTADGVLDASNRIIDVANRCPKSKIVAGGYSQGAAVAGYVTSEKVPPNFPLPVGLTGPMPPEVAEHVAAVSLFGLPTDKFLNFLVRDAPPIQIGPLYQSKVINKCVPEDPICSPTGNDNNAHQAYIGNGMVDQAADDTVRAITAPAKGG